MIRCIRPEVFAEVAMSLESSGVEAVRELFHEVLEAWKDDPEALAEVAVDCMAELMIHAHDRKDEELKREYLEMHYRIQRYARFRFKGEWYDEFCDAFKFYYAEKFESRE